MPPKAASAFIADVARTDVAALRARDRDAGRPRARPARRLGARRGHARAARDRRDHRVGRLAAAPAAGGADSLRWAARTMRAARDFLRAPVLRCSAPVLIALSIGETSVRCSVGDLLGVALGDGRLEAAEVGLDRRGVAAILEPLALGAEDPLLLGGDVGHGKRAAVEDRAAPYYSGLERFDPSRRARGAPARARAMSRATPRSSRSPRASRGSPGSPARSSPRASSAPSRAYSAFTIAFQVPNLVSNLFANAALSAAFVPVFTELLQEGRKNARRSGSPRRSSGSC